MSRSLREAVLAREPLVGTTACLPGVTVAELLAEPFDLIWIDLEHAALGPLDAQELMIGAQAAGAFALARIPAHAHELMAVMLDAGADGVVLAGVEDEAVAREALVRTWRLPDGVRGYGPRRLSLRGRRNGQPPPASTVWAQIESRQGVQRAAEIAELDGIDALVVGTADLSFSLGVPLDTGSKELADAVCEVRRAAESAGAAFGVAGALNDDAALAQGASILVLGTDARLCAGAVDAAARQMRDILKDDPQEIQLS